VYGRKPNKISINEMFHAFEMAFDQRAHNRAILLLFLGNSKSSFFWGFMPQKLTIKYICIDVNVR